MDGVTVGYTMIIIGSVIIGWCARTLWIAWKEHKAEEK